MDLTLFPDVFVNPNLLHQVSASLQGTSLATSCFGHPPERRSASNLGRESGARRSRICERICAVQGRIAMLRSCARTKGANSDELCSSLSQLGTSSAAGSQCSKQHLGRLGERCQLCHSLRRPRGQDGESDGRRKQLAERRELRGRRRSSFSTSKEADRKEQSRKFYQTRQQKRERRAWPKIQEPVSFLGPKGQGRKEGEWRHGSASEPCASEQRRHRNSGIVRNFENIEEVAEERPRQILQPQLRGKLFKQQGPTSQAHRDCQGISKLSEGQKGTATEAATTCEKVPSGDRGFLGVRRVHTLPIGRLHKEVELGKDAHLAAVPSHDQRGASAAASGQGRRDSFATGTEPTSNVSMQLGRRKLDLSLASHLPSRSSGETAVWRGGARLGDHCRIPESYAGVGKEREQMEPPRPRKRREQGQTKGACEAREERAPCRRAGAEVSAAPAKCLKTAPQVEVCEPLFSLINNGHGSFLADSGNTTDPIVGWA